MYDLDHFSMKDATLCGRDLRKLGEGSANMEVVAKRIVDYLYDGLRFGPEQKRATALVRIFKTHPYADLDPGLRESAAGVLPGREFDDETKCLTLLATTGDREEWRNRNTSVGHRAIPLVSSTLVSQFPMISNLIQQLGLEPDMVVKPDPSCLQDLEETTYGVFLVEDAVGNPYIPAQDEFVLPCGIRSVLGFGGILPSGDLFATILFMKTSVSPEIAEYFKSMALSVKLAILHFDQQSVFV